MYIGNFMLWFSYKSSYNDNKSQATCGSCGQKTVESNL